LVFCSATASSERGWQGYEFRGAQRFEKSVGHLGVQLALRADDQQSQGEIELAGL
jgi:hypothetical protein